VPEDSDIIVNFVADEGNYEKKRGDKLPGDFRRVSPDASFSYPADQAEAPEFFSAIDISFSRFLEKIDGRRNPLLAVAASLAIRSVREGNVCLDMRATPQAVAPRDIIALLPERITLKTWQDELRKSSVVGRPGELKPLILDESSRLYLYRYWNYEQEVASFLKKKGSEKSFFQTCIGQSEQERKRLQERLDALFPAAPSSATADEWPETTVDWQKVAAVCVLLNNLTIITGGPGTGKTATIARALILLLEFSPGKLPRIAVAAPTGKAAARLQETILQISADAVGSGSRNMEALPKRALTIHRLIGGTPYSSDFLWNRENPLPFDVVVIDEASLIDLPLFARLIRALPDNARLILLGDREQLASVEAGAVLGDICGDRELNDFSNEFKYSISLLAGAALAESPSASPNPPSPLRDSLIELKKNYRFSSDSGIGALSRAIKNGDGPAALDILKDKGDPACRWLPIPSPAGMPQMINETINYFKEYFEYVDNKGEYSKIFDVFDRFRILCALRHGPYGALEVNRLCEEMFAPERSSPGQGIFYPGRPVMVTKNDYGLKLFNGDIGFFLPALAGNGEFKVFFRSYNGVLRSFSPLRLPLHETAYAMTVHKSQGSEFDKTLLILPSQDTPLLTRELLYTAVTRSRKTVVICGDEAIFLRAVGRTLLRSSGLRDMLFVPSAEGL